MPDLSWKNEQRTILSAMLEDDRLLGSAKNQIRVMLKLLAEDDTIGFDTTSALFYGFLHNPDFIDPGTCPLSQRQLGEAKQALRRQAQIGRAKESALLRKLSRLPLAEFFGNRLDLRDLAVAFLTYASEVQHFTFDAALTSPLYEYLCIPRSVYLNVFDLYHDLNRLGIPFHDLIVSLSRLRIALAVPPSVKTISIVYDHLFEQVLKGLPGSLLKLDGAGLEDFIMETYHREGFQVVRIGGLATAADGGVDIVAFTRNDGLLGDLQLAIQCKATSTKVDASVVRGFNGALMNFKAHKGVLIAKSGFTRDAILETEEQKYKIDLMDYVRLTNAVRGLVLKT